MDKENFQLVLLSGSLLATLVIVLGSFVVIEKQRSQGMIDNGYVWIPAMPGHWEKK